MKVAKSMALMAMGAGALYAYQQYSKPAKKEVKKLAKKASKKMNLN